MTAAEKRETEQRKKAASRDGRHHAANTARARAARKAAELDSLTVDEARAALDHERAGKNRQTLVERLEAAARG